MPGFICDPMPSPRPDARRSTLLRCAIVIVAALALVLPPVPSAQSAGPFAANVVTFDPSTTYQTMGAWEATAQAGQETSPPTPTTARASSTSPSPTWASTGCAWRCARASRTPTTSGPCTWRGGSTTSSGGPTGTPPSTTTPTPAHQLVGVPLLRARQHHGQAGHADAQSVARARRAPVHQPQLRGLHRPERPGTQYIHGDPAEYAELVLATYTHLDERYNVTPDCWEVILEPDNVPSGRSAPPSAAPWSPPRSCSPSTATRSSSSPPAPPAWPMPSPTSTPWRPCRARWGTCRRLSYHRYGRRVGREPQGPRGQGRPVRRGHRDARAHRLGLPGPPQGPRAGQRPSWQQYTLASPFHPPTMGGAYYLVERGTRAIRSSSTRAGPGSCGSTSRHRGGRRQGGAPPTRHLRARSLPGPRGFPVVVVRAKRGGALSVAGLPAARTACPITTNAEYDVHLDNSPSGLAPRWTCPSGDGRAPQ